MWVGFETVGRARIVAARQVADERDAPAIRRHFDFERLAPVHVRA